MKRDRRGTVRETLQDLKGMTRKEKIEHIWSYYNLWIIGIILLIVFLIEVGKIAVNARIETVQSGLLLNVTATEELETCLNEDFLAYVGGDPKKQKMETMFQYYGQTDDAEYAYYTEMSIVARISAQELDYVITDESGFAQLARGDLFLDLRQFFTEDELAAFGDQVLYDTLESGQELPVGLQLNGTEFGRDHLPTELPYYLLFFANSARIDRMDLTLSYLGY